MTQTELFPMARVTDPTTSHQAAEQHEEKLSERRAQVLELVRDYPGSTQGELALRFHTRWPALGILVAAATPHKRLPELEKLGRVRRGPERFCKDSGYLSATWFAV